MAERSFGTSNPSIIAYEIHEWIHAALRIQEGKVNMIQIDGIKRQVFIKFVDNESVHALLRDTSRRVEWKYPNGELSIVNIDMAGMGTKRIRVANLPPEVPNHIHLKSLPLFGKVLNIHAEMWVKISRTRVKWGLEGCDAFDPTPALTYDHSWIQCTCIVRGPTGLMLWLIWGSASVPGMPRAPRNWDGEAEHN